MRLGPVATVFCASLLVALAALAKSPPALSAAEHFQNAAKLAEEGKPRDAQREYLLGLREDPKSFSAYNNLGVLYFGEQDFEHAAAAFADAHRLQPEDTEITFNLGLAQYKAGKPRMAIPLLHASLRSAHAADAHFLLGSCYFVTGSWKDAIAELEEFRALYPARPDVLFMLANAYHYAQRPEPSLQAAKELLQAYPDSPFTHEILGEAYDRAEQPENAIEEFKAAIVSSPEAPELHFVLGYLYWRWRRYDEAAEPLQAEIRINPRFPQPFFYLGDIALRQDSHTEARVWFERALALEPAYDEARLGLAKVMAHQNQLADAIGLFRMAERGLPGNTELHYWLGRSLIRAGRAEEGRKELAKVKELKAAEQRKAQNALNGVPVSERLRSVSSQ
jgi:tetratricopeptide (TPR) repeat protein